MGQTMSITRALVQLKRLDGRIQKATTKPFGFVTCKISGKDFIEGNPTLNKESAEKEAQANLDSVLGLIKQRRDIKAKIVLSNSITIIEINGTEMTVAEAIELKNTINFKHNLVNSLTSQMRQLVARGVKVEEDFEEKLERRIKMEKESGSEQNTIEAVTASFNSNNSVSYINLDRIKEMITELEDEIEAIEADLDQVLSESNSITTIEV